MLRLKNFIELTVSILIFFEGYAIVIFVPQRDRFGADKKIRGSSSVVERQLPKLNVAGSNPVSRSKEKTRKSGLNARFFGLFLFLDFAVWSLFGRYCREKIPKDTKRN